MNIYCIIYNASGLITNLLKHSGAEQSESEHSGEEHSGALHTHKSLYQYQCIISSYIIISFFQRFSIWLSRAL